MSPQPRAGHVRSSIVERRDATYQALFREKARAIQAATPAARASRAHLPLVEYVHDLSPRWEVPYHLTQVAALFERAMRGETVRACVSVPAQFGKTTLVQHGITQTLEQHPEWPIVYASYAAEIAYDKSKETRDLAREAGLTLREDTAAAGRWRLTAGGGLLSTGIGGPLTGYAARLVVVDDPHKNREEAESRRERDKVEGWLRSTALTRLAPGGSCIVVHTRWHPDDLIGRLSADGWEVVNLPAVNDLDESLWPSQRPREFLRMRERELGPYEWAALMMGNPRARGGVVFEATPSTYTTVPDAITKSIGLDLAYSAKTSADWSVAVVMGRVGVGTDARFYVLDVVRAQEKATDFAARLEMVKHRHPQTRPRIYAGGTERGALDFLALAPPRGIGLAVDVKPAIGDKYTRSTPFAAAWNAGHVYVREGAAWANDFCDEIARFTGQSDPHDDQVDAAAAAFDVLAENQSAGITTAGRRDVASYGDRPTARGWNMR